MLKGKRLQATERLSWEIRKMWRIQMFRQTNLTPNWDTKLAWLIYGALKTLWVDLSLAPFIPSVKSTGFKASIRHIQLPVPVTTPRLQSLHPSERENGILSNRNALRWASSSVARGRFNARTISMTACHFDIYYASIRLLLKLKMGSKQQWNEHYSKHAWVHAFAAVMATVAEEGFGLVALGLQQEPTSINTVYPFNSSFWQ